MPPSRAWLRSRCRLRQEWSDRLRPSQNGARRRHHGDARRCASSLDWPFNSPQRQAGKAAFAKERVRGRQPPAEGLVRFGRVLPAAGGIDAIAQPFRGGGIENVAGLLKGGKRVGV